MRRVSRQYQLAVLLLVIVAAVGCLHKTGANGAPAPVTPWEHVTVDNARFAQANNTLAHGTADVQAAGLLTVAQAGAVLNYTGQVTATHDKITDIIAKGSAVTSSDVASIQALVDQIRQSGKDLVASGGLGIKNPRSQQSISDEIDALRTLAASLVSEITTIQQAKGGQ